MKGRSSVGCIALRDHAEEPILLLRRAFGRLKHEWCFVTGKVERGESPREAAARELLEETGLSAGEISFLHAFRGRSNRVQRVFMARVTGVSDVRLDSEHTAWRWASFAEAETLLAVPAQRRALQLARACASTRPTPRK